MPGSSGKQVIEYPENVAYAVPKIKEVLDLDSIWSVAAVVKWYHSRRAIMTLKRNLPIKARYFALSYEPRASSFRLVVD